MKNAVVPHLAGHLHHGAAGIDFAAPVFLQKYFIYVVTDRILCYNVIEPLPKMIINTVKLF